MPAPTPLPASLDAALGRIHHHDCIAGMSALPAGSVDLAFADPPFNIGYDYDVYHDAKDYEEYLAWSRQWIGAVHRVLKPDGTFWLAIGDEYAAELKLESQKLGFHIRSWVIWYYTFGVNCKFKFSRSHAHLFHFVKNPKQFTFRSEEPENRIPSARLLVYEDSRGNPKGRLPDDTWILRPEDASGMFSPDDTWVLRPQDLAGHFSSTEENWYFPRVAGTFKERAGFHGCQMPEQLLGRIIRFCSHESEVILDPFSGSATTLAVAKKLNRRFLGYDLSEAYVRQGQQRLATIQIGDPLDGATEPTMSAPRTGNPRKSKTKTNNKEPLETVLAASAERQTEWSHDQFMKGLVDAFTRVHDGFSLDRVIADPEFNSRLATECKQLGLPGDIRWWNLRLFKARKAGLLSHLPTQRRTELSWEHCDSFLFGSEIAWKALLDRGFSSLDAVFCDPVAATEFDRLAAAIAPGFSSLEYRWGALKLRKESKRARSRAGTIRMRKFNEPFSDPIPVSRRFSTVPDASGVYLVIDAEKLSPLYAGEALKLRTRLENHFRGPAKRFWNDCASKLMVKYFEAAPEVSLLLAYQSLCVSRHHPSLNVPEKALV